MDASGTVLKQEEDRSGNGKPDRTVYFKKDGKVDRLEQDSNGNGCIDLRQWYDGKEQVRAEYLDSTGNCKTDVWSYYENGKLARQGIDTKGRGRPDVLNHLDRSQNVVIQEVASDGGDPDKKLFLAAGGKVTAQCFLDDAKKKLNTRTVVSNGQVVEVLVDTTGNGVADTREIYENGDRIRLEVDTNDDRRPDVVQAVGEGGLPLQDEDVDFDGVVDRRFQGDQLVETASGTEIAGEPWKTRWSHRRCAFSFRHSIVSFVSSNRAHASRPAGAGQARGPVGAA